MRFLRKRAGTAAAMAILLAGSAMLTAQDKANVNVNGKWVLTVMTEAGGTTMPTVMLKQEGEKLTGRYSSLTLGEAEVTGTVKGQQIEFAFDAGVQGISLHVIYTGTVKGDTMSGKISLGELGDGTFTGKKQ